ARAAADAPPGEAATPASCGSPMSPSFSPPSLAVELGDDTQPMIAIGQVTWSFGTSRSPRRRPRLDHAVPSARFHSPIGRHDLLPSLLQVGYGEAARLLRPPASRGGWRN